MKRLDLSVQKKLKNQYSFALLVLAFLTIFGQVLIQSYLHESIADANLINKAGKQRMLSQRLTKITLLNLYGKTIDTTFNSNFHIWENQHKEFLVNSITKSEYAKNLALHSAFKVLQTEFKKISEKKTFNLDLILKNEVVFLSEMENSVKTFEIKANKRIENIRTLFLVLFFLILGTLLVETFMIFVPLTDYVKTVIGQITSSEGKLAETNSQLRYSNQMLLRTQEDLKTLNIAQEKLRKKEESVRTQSILLGQEEERKRLSREIHDGVGQLLTGIKLRALKLRNLGITDIKHHETLDILQKLINETIEVTRSLSSELMPPTLVDFGLVSVLEKLKNQHTEKPKLHLITANLENRFDPNTEIALYRIIQEALNNTQKYALADNFYIKLYKKADQIELSLTDDGGGFNVALLSDNKHSIINNGIVNIKTRVSLLKGSFKIESKIGFGTEIFITLPLYNLDK